MTPKRWENKSGCKDPTAYSVEKTILEDEQRKDELIWVIKKIIRWAGFELMNRIELRDRKSGRIFK